MSHPLRFVSEASTELEQAARWYEQHRAGLGVGFLEAVDEAVEALVRWPRAGALLEGLPDDLDVRRVPVDRFPYHLAYLVTQDQIHVVAVAHDRRRPAYWSGRLDA